MPFNKVEAIALPFVHLLTGPQSSVAEFYTIAAVKRNNSS